MLTLPSFSIRKQSLSIAIGISLILHVVFMFNYQPEIKHDGNSKTTPDLEISLNKYAAPQPAQEKPQKPIQPEPVAAPAPANAPSPKTNKVVRSKVVKPKLAPPLRTRPIQADEKSVSNTTLTSESKKQSPTSVDNTDSRRRQMQKIKADYLAELALWLNQHKRYPAVARRRGQEGEISVRFSINTEGKLLSHEILSPAKHTSLNAAVVKMLKEASPMPAIPLELRNGKTKFEYTIPVLFKLTGKS